MNYSEIIAAISHPVFSTERNGRIRFCNAAATQKLRLNAGGMFSACKPLWEEAHEYISSAKNAAGMHIDNLEIYDNRFKIQVNISRETARDVFIFYAEDVTEKEKYKEAVKRFKEQAKQLDAIVNATSDGVWVCDADSRITLINPAAERINHVKKEEVIGKSMYELVSTGFIDRSAVIEVIKTEAPISLLQRREGRKLTSTGTPVFDENGNLTTVVVSTQDVTELDQLRKELDRQEMLNDTYRSQIIELEKKTIDGVEFIAKSRNIRYVYQQALKVSRFDSTVLLFGESGTGKGFFARLIHHRSKRSEKPFISINCGALPDSLIESELFGYEKGAFTGAQARKRGLIEVADGGVLFLDEIAELPMAAQVKLLKFIEDGEVTRVGSTQYQKVNVKIIAATHRDLSSRVRERKFREDLFYRLNVIPIRIPPLRERKDCLLPLINYYIGKICRLNKVKKSLSKDALDCLLKFKYPGNIRQLINLCERLVVMTDREVVQMADLPQEIICTIPQGSQSSMINTRKALKAVLEDVEKLMIDQAAKACSTQMEMAEQLGISQASVARKVKKYAVHGG